MQGEKHANKCERRRRSKKEFHTHDDTAIRVGRGDGLKLAIKRGLTPSFALRPTLVRAHIDAFGVCNAAAAASRQYAADETEGGEQKITRALATATAAATAATEAERCARKFINLRERRKQVNFLFLVFAERIRIVESIKQSAKIFWTRKQKAAIFMFATFDRNFLLSIFIRNAHS